MAKHKFACISLTVRDRAISSKFSTHRVFEHSTFGNFKKIFPSPKMVAILNFPIFAKNGKTRIYFYLLNCVTQSDFVEIFDPQGIRAMYSCQFQKIFPSSKMAAILNFRILAKNGKTQKFLTHRLSQKCTLSNFQKNFPSPKMATILNFRIFAQNGKTRICFYLLNRAR